MQTFRACYRSEIGPLEVVGNKNPVLSCLRFGRMLNKNI